MRKLLVLSVIVWGLYATSTAAAHWNQTPWQIKQMHTVHAKIKAYERNVSHAGFAIKWIKHNTRFFSYNEWAAKLQAHRYVIRVSKQKLASLRLSLRPVVDSCTDALLRREGGYNPHATNPTSGAYGGPQALPGSKMSSAGADWRDNIWTQIRWMHGYMNSLYGGSCQALAHSYSYGWY